MNFTSTPPMNSLRRSLQQLLKAMEFVNIDRLDELERLLEQHEAARFAQASHNLVAARCSSRPRHFGDERVIDFLPFARRTAFRASGRGG